MFEDVLFVLVPKSLADDVSDFRKASSNFRFNHVIVFLVISVQEHSYITISQMYSHNLNISWPLANISMLQTYISRYLKFLSENNWIITFIYLIFYTFFTFLIYPRVYADITRERSYGWMDALSATGSALVHMECLTGGTNLQRSLGTRHLISVSFDQISK